MEEDGGENATTPEGADAKRQERIDYIRSWLKRAEGFPEIGETHRKPQAELDTLLLEKQAAKPSHVQLQDTMFKFNEKRKALERK